MHTNLSPDVMSPLADPVVSAIFSGVEAAGLAAKSLISVILEPEGTFLSGKIIRVTPQHYHVDPTTRSCRVDVEAETDANERVIFEIQTLNEQNQKL